jgi:hypothetical protein
MGIKIDTNSRKAVFKIRHLADLTKAGIEHAAWTSARGLRTATGKEILRKPKGGRVYTSRTRSGARRKHTASAPGETHANFSGTLRRSLDFNMKPRPSLQNGIRSERRNFQSNFEREIGKRLGDKVII